MSIPLTNGHSPQISAPDGPLNIATYCQECGMYCDCDIYRWRSRILCGDCRFFARHGHWPHRTPTQSISAGRKATEPSMSFSLNRVNEFYAVSIQHMQFIEQWITECQLSLK